MIQLENSSQEAAIFQNFNLLVQSQSGVDRLTDLIFSLAINGKLTKRVSSNTKLTFDLKKLRLEEDRLWGHQFLEDCPQTWARLPLAKLGSWGSGGTPSRGNKEYFGGNIPWLIIGDLNDGIVTRASNSITQKGLQESSATKVPIGAVLIAMYGSIGKSGIAGIECATNQAIAHCIPNSEIITSKFLFYLIRATRPKLFAQGRGLAQQNISQTILKHLMVAVPPLEEQALIVSKIEELIRYCDQLKVAIHLRDQVGASARKSAVDAISAAQSDEEFETAWNRIQQNWDLIAGSTEAISDLRALILNLAVKGRLTSRMTKYNSAAKELASVKKTEVRELFSGTDSESDVYPKGWAVASFPNIGQWVAGSGFPTEEQGHTDKEILFCKVSDMNLPANSRHLIEANNTIDSATAKKLRATILKEGTVVFPKIGGAIATNKRRLIVKPTIVDNNCMGITPCSVIDSEWLFILLSSIDFVKYQSGTSIPSISQKTLDQIEFGVPPLNEQKMIVEKVSQLMKICDELENRILEKDYIAENFAKSIVAASA